MKKSQLLLHFLQETCFKKIYGWQCNMNRLQHEERVTWKVQHKKAAWMWCNTGKAQHEKNPIWREFTQKSGKHQNSEKSETQRKHEKRKKQHTLKECDAKKLQNEKTAAWRKQEKGKKQRNTKTVRHGKSATWKKNRTVQNLEKCVKEECTIVHKRRLRDSYYTIL